MNSARDRILFWCLIAGQAVGSQILIWGGLPVYQRLRSTAEGATASEFAIAFAAVALMQACHWPALALTRRLEFGRNVVLGHVLVCIGELSLFFVAALTASIAFDHFKELKLTLWKLFMLGAMVFAISAYKYQLMSLGESMIEAEPDDSTEQALPGS